MYSLAAVGTPLGIKVMWLAEGSDELMLGGAASVKISYFLCLEIILGLIGL